MASYGKQSKLSPERVLEAADKFFGRLGLQRQDAAGGCARFTGGGGFVAISTCLQDRGCEVTLETQEWDLQVREFLGKI
jgi:hypothetical protein